MNIKILISVLMLAAAVQASGVTPIEGRLLVRTSSAELQGQSDKPLFIVELPENVTGTLEPHPQSPKDKSHPAPYMTRIEDPNAISEDDSIPLKIRMHSSRRSLELVAETRPDTGKYELHIPEGLFDIYPLTYEDVDTIDIPEDLLAGLSVGGAWHVKGKNWTGTPMFSFHDDDGVDGVFNTLPANHPYGYFTILYPLLESLGLRGCVSMEGRRTGWLSGSGELNENALTAIRLQNERGWEIMSHSMTCLGEIKNNWVVDNLDTPQADKIFSEAVFKGIDSPLTTTVYNREDGIQYSAVKDEGWTESKRRLIKPFASDYPTKQVMLYNPDYDADYQWGEWFVKARESGMNCNSWVMHNAHSSHANIPVLAGICPYGFVDVWPVVYNEPPLMTAATRMLCEGQMFGGVPAESSTDNSYNQKQYEWLKNKINEACDNHAWIVMGMHAYRNCWKNSLPGALVSEGGDYPDEWVLPMEGVDPLNDPLTPPARLGINDWSEWYPCPGTRLRMMWDLLRYAKDKGMLHVTSSEGFQIMGNRRSVGYFSKGKKFGFDVAGIEGTRNLYPHYVVGANDEIYYYASAGSDGVSFQCSIDEDENGKRRITGAEGAMPLKEAYSLAGLKLNVDVPDRLPQGVWIIEGRKILVK